MTNYLSDLADFYPDQYSCNHIDNQSNIAIINLSELPIDGQPEFKKLVVRNNRFFFSEQAVISLLSCIPR